MSTNSGVRFWLPLDAQPGPASRISRVRAASIIDAAMNFEAKNSQVNLRRPPPRRRLWSRVPLLAAAALILPVTVVAGAVRYVAVRRAATAGLVVSTRTLAPTVETKEAKTTSAPIVEAVVNPAVVAVENEPAAVISEPRVETTQPKLAAAAHRSPAPAEASAEDMLQQANDLRARRQWLAASQIYEKTRRTYPSRAEAYSAMVAAGMLHLDQLGDAKGALSLFSSAVRARPKGPLSEEARWGAIQAHRALGDTASELAALQEFAGLYPQSLLATRAHARLRELRGETGTQ
jgi:tetratricopeptide (TPR) repeat protein